jgi:AAHS family 4-hydroxybenzoate transporter-like MFS transporter
VALNFGGVLGSALLSRFIDGSPRSLLALCLFYIVAAGLIAATGWVASSAWIVLAALGAFGLFHIGAQLSMTTFAAEFYPTAVRGSGLGWMQAISRIGSLIGPVIGGYLVASGMPLHDLFLLGIIPALLACACLFCLFLLSKNSAKISEEA